MRQIALVQLVTFLDGISAKDVDLGTLRKLVAASAELDKPIHDFRSSLIKAEELRSELARKYAEPGIEDEEKIKTYAALIKANEKIEALRKAGDDVQVEPKLESTEYMAVVRKVFEDKHQGANWINNSVVLEIADFLGV